MANVATYAGLDQVIHGDRVLLLPCSGAGSDIPIGTMMQPGITGGTNLGVAIPITATANDDAIGLLSELHSFSKSGDALVSTLVPWYQQPGSALRSSSYTQFPSHPINLLDTGVLMRVDYGMAGNIAVASATSTVLTITSLAANADSSFFAVIAGTDIGDVVFAKTTASGSATLISASSVTMDSTSTLTQVLPLFYKLVTWLVNTATVPSLIDSAAAAGTGKACVLQNNIYINSAQYFLDPKQHHKYTGTQNLATFRLSSLLAVSDSIFHPQD